ncbi:transporter substrate-binding domain-containing protein [Candidatus Parcubacteria bacterium]|nr:transporter substrate-binding domain-containing protein [Candidatus Parcubacteria bacterium]
MLSRKIIFLSFLALAIFLSLFGLFFPKFPFPKIQKETTLSKILSQKKLIVGTEAYYFPMEYITPEGKFDGFDIDLAKEIAKRLGVTVEFENIPWDELFLALENKKVDIVVAAVTITPERAKLYSFSHPYFNAGQVIVTKKDFNFSKLEDLMGKSIGAQKETTSEMKAKEITFPEKVISFSNNEIATEALLKGEIDALVIDYPAARGLIEKEKELKIATEPLTQEFYGIVLRKEDEDLLEKINSIITSLKEEGKLKELEEKWFKL